jgi:iron-sulfur cluster assembly protein
MSISLTSAAAARVQQFQQQNAAAIGLRFGVKKTGCSGFAYVVDVTETQMSDDLVFESQGVKVFVDPASLAVVQGTEIDYQRQGLNSTFVFANPNVTGACGCGESFSIEREAI